jgi:hypothetical protein
MPVNKHKGTLVDRLKGVRAELVTLHVYTADEDAPREVAVPNVRQKWQRVMEVLDEVQWTRVEAMDKKKSILLVHNRSASDERPAGELEELAGGASGRAAELSSVLGVAVHWVLRAQDVALSRQMEATASIADAQNRLVDSTMKRFEQMDKQYTEMLHLNHAMHGERFAAAERALRDARADADEVRETSSDKLLGELAPALVKSMLTPKDAPTKPNGTAKPKVTG